MVATQSGLREHAHHDGTGNDAHRCFGATLEAAWLFAYGQSLVDGDTNALNRLHGRFGCAWWMLTQYVERSARYAIVGVRMQSLRRAV